MPATVGVGPSEAVAPEYDRDMPEAVLLNEPDQVNGEEPVAVAIAVLVQGTVTRGLVAKAAQLMAGAALTVKVQAVGTVAEAQTESTTETVYVKVEALVGVQLSVEPVTVAPVRPDTEKT